MQVTLAPYSEKVKEAYGHLLPEQGQEIAKGKLDWKFGQNPCAEGVLALAVEGGEVIGINAFMPARFKMLDRKIVAYQSMDTIVGEKARGKGVFGKLINSFYENSGAHVLYGFPNQNSSPGFFGKLGWKSFGAMPLLIRPLRTGYFLRKVAPFLPDVRIPVLKRRPKQLNLVTEFGPSHTQAWTRFSEDIGCAIVRDSDYLNWRLCAHPTYEYQILGGADGAFAAYAVVHKHGGRIGYLMEAIGDAAILPRLITGALHEMQDHGADAALACCLPGSPNYRAYRTAGFYPFPLALRPIHINLGARAITPDAMPAEDSRNWYVSYLDSDTA